MSKIIKQETGFRGKISKVAYVKKCVLRYISGDGLVKHHKDAGEYATFETEDAALEFCAEKDMYDVVILPMVAKEWFVD